MTPKERAILALQLKQPDYVPHFELEMQLTEEYFGKRFVSKEEWESNPSRKKEYLKKDAELLIQIADKFDYGIIMYSSVHRPTLKDYFEGIKILRELDNGRRLLMAHGDSTLAIPDGNTMTQLTVDLYESPEKIKNKQERDLNTALEVGRKAMDTGLDGFILCCDYCFNKGPFLSPQMFSEFVTPYLSRLIQGYREMGAYVIKHTDGNIMPILDQILSCHPHGLHSLDPMAGVDIKKIKKLHGKEICLIGNVNCALMQTGTDEEILDSCRYAMENGKPDGGYMFSTSNVIFKGMPKHSYDLMLDFYQKNKYY